MTFDDSRDNVTDIEANLTEADAREEVRNEWWTWPIPVAPCAEKIFDDGSANDDGESFPGDQSVDGGVPFHRPAGWLAEYVDEDFDGPEDDDDSEDDGQPSEYDEWQDYMGGDEYYDHSENSMW